MIDFGTAAQTAFFNALDAGLTCPVTDRAAQGDKSNPISDFPSCTIGESNAVNFDTDTGLAAEVILTLHFWSRTPGMMEVRQHMGEAYASLHRQLLSLPGYRFNRAFVDREDASTDPDGKTRHGIQTYRVRVWWTGWGSQSGVWRDWDFWDDSATWNEGG